MLADVLTYLRCPHCRASLDLAGGMVRCTAGHAFDVARQGYVNLLPGDARAGAGDTAGMVRARHDFLGRGHFAGLADRITELATAGLAADGCVADVGAGTGYHLARLLDALPDRVGLALDVSKYAVRRAARAHPRIGAAACDTWRSLPVRDGAAAAVLDVFAPRNGPEFRRILAPGGILVVVTPTPRHLRELVTTLGLLTVDERKEERVAGTLGGSFTAGTSLVHEETPLLAHEDVEALVAMGPSAWHTAPRVVAERVAHLPNPVPVTLSVTLTTYRPVP
ncbi:MAG: 23S rRNA methyltransferase [Streptosporangiales bacterium]|nr:23S rRNA methyltransferase [Streptosporangiales bacterium]